MGYRPKASYASNTTVDIYQLVPSIGSGGDNRPDEKYYLKIEDFRECIKISLEIFNEYFNFNIKKFNNISQTVSHFGFSLLILSILFNSILSSEIITNIKIGERYDYNKGEIFFKKTEEKKESNFNSIIAFFEIKDKNGKTIELKPEIRIYNQPIIITSEADIRTTLLEDKFLVMNLVKGNEYFNIRYQVKPFMVWIWISVLLLSLGGLMSLFKREI